MQSNPRRDCISSVRSDSPEFEWVKWNKRWREGIESFPEYSCGTRLPLWERDSKTECLLSRRTGVLLETLGSRRTMALAGRSWKCSSAKGNGERILLRFVQSRSFTYFHLGFLCVSQLYCNTQSFITLHWCNMRKCFDLEMHSWSSRDKWGQGQGRKKCSEESTYGWNLSYFLLKDYSNARKRTGNWFMSHRFQKYNIIFLSSS